MSQKHRHRQLLVPELSEECSENGISVGADQSRTGQWLSDHSAQISDLYCLHCSSIKAKERLEDCETNHSPCMLNAVREEAYA